jgi:hypothetical protein
MKTLLTALFFISFFELLAQATIIEKVVNEKGKPIPSAIVLLKQNDSIVRKTETNNEGEFKISNIEPGIYDIETKFKDKYMEKLIGVQIKNGTVLPLKDVVFDVKKYKINGS